MKEAAAVVVWFVSFQTFFFFFFNKKRKRDSPPPNPSIRQHKGVPRPAAILIKKIWIQHRLISYNSHQDCLYSHMPIVSLDDFLLQSWLSVSIDDVDDLYPIDRFDPYRRATELLYYITSQRWNSKYHRETVGEDQRSRQMFNE